jgi:hypothetical protein
MYVLSLTMLVVGYLVCLYFQRVVDHSCDDALFHTSPADGHLIGRGCHAGPKEHDTLTMPLCERQRALPKAFTRKRWQVREAR